MERTFETLDRLEKHWGHFYNWYETQTLQPLPPRYISTVDSGNLLGCLLTLAHGLREKAEAPVLGPAVIHGLADTLGLAAEERSGEAVRVLSRTMSSGSRRRPAGGVPSRIARMSEAAASRPMSAAGVATVVRRGFEIEVNGMPSKPTIATSPGIRIPSVRSASMSPSASLSS